MLLTFSSDKSSPLSTQLFLWKGFDWFDLQKHTQSIRSNTQLVGIVTSCFIFFQPAQEASYQARLRTHPLSLVVA